MPTDNKSEIVIFKTADEKISVDVRFEGETVWLTQAQLVDLYGSSKANVSEHIKHVSGEEELIEVFSQIKKTDIVKNFVISLPSTETLPKFQNIIRPIFEKVIATQREIKQLETLRDTLLPKWVNGDLSLNF